MKASRIKWALTLSAAAVALVACGGSSDPVLVATADLSAPLTASAGPALLGTTVSFGAVPEFGTTGTTTLAVSGTAAAQSATISSGGQTASGPMTYGSCIFTITSSTFTPSSPLAFGKQVVVNPCSITVSTAGVVANGGESLRNVEMQMGTTVSKFPLIVSITPSGQVSVNGRSLGGLTLTPTTGGGS